MHPVFSPSKLSNAYDFGNNSVLTLIQRLRYQNLSSSTEYVARALVASNVSRQSDVAAVARQPLTSFNTEA